MRSRQQKKTGQDIPADKAKGEKRQVEIQSSQLDTETWWDWVEAMLFGVCVSSILFGCFVGGFYVLQSYGYTHNVERIVLEYVDQWIYPQEKAYVNNQGYHYEESKWGQKQQEEHLDEDEWIHSGGRDNRRTHDSDDLCPFECSRTKICVSDPIDCPCFSQFETKCKVGEWYICLEPPRTCAEIV